MSQKVTSVPNPRFAVAPITTVAGSIISRRRVKIPVTNTQPYFTGQRNSSAFTAQNFAYWDIADNESFLDLSKMVIVMDLTFHSYQALAPCFDGSTQALLWKVEIGNSQGLKIEEIQNYNLWASAISQYTETAAHRENTLLDMSDYDNSVFKSKDWNHMIDSTYYAYGSSAVTPEHPTRIHLRLHHSSFLNNVKLLPLFLFRNGIRIQVYFESVYKAFVLNKAPNQSSEVQIPILNCSLDNWLISTNTAQPANSRATIQAQLIASSSANAHKLNWFIGPGIHRLDGTLAANTTAVNGFIANGVNAAAGVTGNNAFGFQRGNAYIPYFRNYSQGQLITRTSHNAFYMKSNLYLKYVAPYVGSPPTSATREKFVCVPIKFHHNGQLIWTGFLYKNISYSPPATTEILSKEGINYTLTSPGQPPANTFEVVAPYGPNFGFYQPPQDSVANNANIFAYQGSVGGSGQFIPFHMSSYNPEGTLPYYAFVNNYNTSNSLSLADLSQAVVDLVWAKAEATIDEKGIFYIESDSTNDPIHLVKNITPCNGSANYIHPLLSLWMVQETTPSSSGTVVSTAWTYDLKNLEILADLVKPSAMDFENFQRAFLSPSGIPYKYKRLLYRKNSFQYTSGMVNINIAVGVRSMSGIMILIQDPLCDQEARDSTRYMLPALSSFMRKGLTRAEVVVGGQQYPVYQLYMKPNYTDKTAYTDAHIPEVENFLGNTDINPSFNRLRNQYTRNYMQCGFFDQTMSSINNLLTGNIGAAGAGNFPTSYGSATYTNSQDHLYAVPFPPSWTVPALDASSFVMGLSLQKDDINTFGTGIDSSQSGAVQLNLYFQDSGFKGSWFQENIDVHTYVVCDAVFTKQNDADLVRY